MTLLHTIAHPSRLHDVKFCKRVDSDDEILLAGAEDKKVTIYDVTNTQAEHPPKIIGAMVGHSNRYLSNSLSISPLSDEQSKGSTDIIDCSPIA